DRRRRYRLAWRSDRSQERTACKSRFACRRIDFVGFRLGFWFAARLPLHHRHRGGRRMGRRHGAPQRGLAQRAPRLRFLRGAGDVGRRHRDCSLGRDLRADQSERESILACGVPLRRPADLPDDLHPRQNAGIAAVERIRAAAQEWRAATGKSRRAHIDLGDSTRRLAKYFAIGTLMCGAYIISYQAISIFMPTLMIRDLHANPGAVRTVTLIWSAFSATGLLLAGLASD